MRKKENFLVYDASCAFCTGLAGYFHSKWQIKIVSNDNRINNIDKDIIKKDVHFVCFVDETVLVYHGAEAAVRMVGTKYPILIRLYGIIGIRQLIQLFYWIVKKLRKHLGNLFLKT